MKEKDEAEMRKDWAESGGPHADIKTEEVALELGGAPPLTRNPEDSGPAVEPSPEDAVRKKKEKPEQEGADEEPDAAWQACQNRMAALCSQLYNGGKVKRRPKPPCLGGRPRPNGTCGGAGKAPKPREQPRPEKDKDRDKEEE